MAHHFTPGTGFFVHTPSWHRLEKQVLTDWPGDWATARKEADLLWEPSSEPLYVRKAAPVVDHGDGSFTVPGYDYEEVEGFQRVFRNDNGHTLGVQTKQYRVIDNTAFGYVIESLMGTDIWGSALKYEGVFELHEGAVVIAVVYLEDPIRVDGDDSPTYRYAVFMTRHDGRGGLRVILTNVRVVCANTAGLAEAGAKEEETAFTIRHASNWDERVAEVREKLAAAVAANDRYYELMDTFAGKKVTPNVQTRMIKQFLPIGDDMGARQQRNREQEREIFRTILKSDTIPLDHEKTVYGWFQAATEFTDHHRAYRSASSYVTRQLVDKSPLKERAFSIAKRYAGVRG